jgi:hypothetical protein
MKSGNFNHLETSGLVQACTGVALLLRVTFTSQFRRFSVINLPDHCSEITELLGSKSTALLLDQMLVTYEHDKMF